MEISSQDIVKYLKKDATLNGIALKYNKTKNEVQKAVYKYIKENYSKYEKQGDIYLKNDELENSRIERDMIIAHELRRLTNEELIKEVRARVKAQLEKIKAERINVKQFVNK